MICKLFRPNDGAVGKDVIFGIRNRITIYVCHNCQRLNVTEPEKRSLSTQISVFELAAGFLRCLCVCVASEYFYSFFCFIIYYWFSCVF